MTLPNPFISADQHPLSAETAAAESQPRATAAEVLPDPPSNEGRHQGAPAVEEWNPDAAGATDCIGEIFVGAQKLESRFVLDERAFMDAIEPPPLFLQRAV
jgi:hypothetical protein